MNRPLRHARRTLPVLSLAALSVVAAAGSAGAAPTCTAPAVEATINLDGTEIPGCRVIYRYTGEPIPMFIAPPGGARARILVVGGGGGGSVINVAHPNLGADGAQAGTGGGGGGMGGEVVTELATLGAGNHYDVSAGYGGQVGGVSLPLGGVYSTVMNGTGGLFSQFRGPDVTITARGGEGGKSNLLDPDTVTGRGGYFPGESGVTQGAFGTADGGGGGGSWSGTRAATSGSVIAGVTTGGAGADGVDVSAVFPGLAETRFGGGGGGFATGAGGPATDGGGAGGFGSTTDVAIGAAGASGTDGTGGGGGGGARVNYLGGEANSSNFTTTGWWGPGSGGSGLIVMDFLPNEVPSPTPDSGSGSGGSASGGSSSGGSSSSSGSGTTVAALKATTPRASGPVITTTVTAPEAGTAMLTAAPAVAPKAITCTSRRSFTAVATARMTCTPGAGVQVLRRFAPVRLKVTVAFRPSSGGAAQRLSVGTVTLPKIKGSARPIAVTG